ncbi:hypothetical protein BC830DRAFT_480178 [Chytriomyces sp. MP71]|nr:hypothetical protein BC830DRAFT_480178 [Chytriomyces sp. MP71]
MAYGENLTSHVKGMVPIHHLVELSYVDPNPPPYPLSPVASLSRIQAGEGFTPVSPTLSSKKVEATLSPRPPSYIPLSPSESTDSKKALSPSMSKNTMNTGRTPSTMTTSSVGTSGSKGGFFSKFKKQETETISVAPVRPITVDGVVNVETLVAHLGLLHRFCVLENKDDQLADWRYLCRAEQRYLMWLDYLREEQPDPSSIPLPPLE